MLGKRPINMKIMGAAETMINDIGIRFIDWQPNLPKKLEQQNYSSLKPMGQRVAANPLVWGSMARLMYLEEAGR